MTGAGGEAESKSSTTQSLPNLKSALGSSASPPSSQTPTPPDDDHVPGIGTIQPFLFPIQMSATSDTPSSADSYHSVQSSGKTKGYHRSRHHHTTHHRRQDTVSTAAAAAAVIYPGMTQQQPIPSRNTNNILISEPRRSASAPHSRVGSYSTFAAAAVMLQTIVSSPNSPPSSPPRTQT